MEPLKAIPFLIFTDFPFQTFTTCGGGCEDYSNGLCEGQIETFFPSFTNSTLIKWGWFTWRSGEKYFVNSVVERLQKSSRNNKDDHGVKRTTRAQSDLSCFPLFMKVVKRVNFDACSIAIFCENFLWLSSRWRKWSFLSSLLYISFFMVFWRGCKNGEMMNRVLNSILIEEEEKEIF